VWWNERLAALSGRGADEVRGRRVAELSDGLSRVLTHDGEHRLTVSGRDVPVRVSRTSAADGLDGARIVVVEDLSATKQLEAQVRHQDRLATIGRFAAGVAHEVGNPLAAVMMVASGMERDGEVTPERLSGLLDAARRIDAIVRSLVSFARTGASRPDAPAQAVSVDAVAHQAVNLVRLSRRRDIVLEPNAPDAIVEGHSAELVQVVVNLLSNALDATPEGRRVAVTTRAEAQEVVLEVIDEGAGMPPEVAAHVFEPFFTTKDVGAGTGLGLSVAWTIVEGHGGRLSVDSAPGRGTTMTMRLPRSGPPRP
jgi:signal transduction histidine kinase